MLNFLFLILPIALLEFIKRKYFRFSQLFSAQPAKLVEQEPPKPEDKEELKKNTYVTYFNEEMQFKYFAVKGWNKPKKVPKYTEE